MSLISPVARRLRRCRRVRRGDHVFGAAEQTPSSHRRRQGTARSARCRRAARAPSGAAQSTEGCRPRARRAIGAGAVASGRAALGRAGAAPVSLPERCAPDRGRPADGVRAGGRPGAAARRSPRPRPRSGRRVALPDGSDGRRSGSPRCSGRRSWGRSAVPPAGRGLDPGDAAARAARPGRHPRRQLRGRAGRLGALATDAGDLATGREPEAAIRPYPANTNGLRPVKQTPRSPRRQTRQAIATSALEQRVARSGCRRPSS